MISKSTLHTAQALMMASAMSMNTPAKTQIPAIYNTTNRTRKETMKRKKRRLMAKASRKVNRKSK